MESLETRITKLKRSIEQGTYEQVSTLLARSNAELSVRKLTELADYWKTMGKEVYEPAFCKFILDPLGVPHQGIEGFTYDFIVNQKGADLKLETAPFFNHDPIYTRTLNRDDVGFIGKNIDDAVFYLWHIRVPGTRWDYCGNVVTYEGKRIDVVCRTTVGEIRRLIRLHNLECEPYEKRRDETSNSGNEKDRYVMDIRWFPLTWRFAGGRWVESDWTEAELQEDFRSAAKRVELDIETGEIPPYISKRAAAAS